ncbi:MAG TPA: sugar phosphate isomerase/epimerase [Gaiellaceae bacterium]|nr:sugar phosphate isomerase/epimerase [Gaiellaceae bacterium]
MSRAMQQQPLFSISQVSTLAASFGDDLRAYVAAGADGIGVWEIKLGGDSLEEFRATGLGCATAVPAVPSVHPLPLLPGPETPRERVDALLRSLEILAPYAPSAVLCFTGPGDRDTAVRGVREIAREAERLDLRLALEPFQLEDIENWSILNTLGDAAGFIDEVGSDAIGIQFDTWALWNTPGLFDEIPRYAHLIAGVHVSDWREPTRGWADRVLPGDGAADLPGIFGVLEDVGWEGFYDLEIFSDNGTFGSAYPDSLWDLDAAELARRGREAFFNCWSKRRVPATAVGRRGET